MALATPYLMGISIDEALESGFRSKLLILAGAIILASVLRGLFSYGQAYLSEAVSQRAAYDIRNDFFRKLQTLSFGFHDREQTGDLMSSATADVEAVRGFTSHGLLRVLTIVLMLGVVFFHLTSTNWRLGLLCMALIPLVTWLSLTLKRNLRRLWDSVQSHTGDMTSVLQENLTGIRLVKAFGAGRHQEERFAREALAVANHSFEASAVGASRSAVLAFVFTALTGAILLLGGKEVIAGRLTPGELAAFIFYMPLLTSRIRSIGGLVNSFTMAAAAGQRIFRVLDAESPVRERAGAGALPRVRGDVRFDSVSFSYQGSSSALRDVSFEAEAGQLVAIVGGPGSGKSSLVHLIPRFYDVSGGHISIDGVDVRDVTLASLRKNVGIVLQDVFVFGGTIRDNIAYGKANSSLEDVERAAGIAQLHRYVDALPAGYDTRIGERGATLSGGQRQRLAIARTLLMDPPVLILDDSTSSVDAETEHSLQRALREVVKGRTTFVIAHRLSTVREADIVLVMEQGQIVERGTHSDLARSGGAYSRLCDLQLAPPPGQADGVAAPLVGSVA